MAAVTDHSQVASLRRDLGDGLVLRSAGHRDGDELVEFNAAMHADARSPQSVLADWTRDLFETPHPTFQVDRDVTVVEDTASGRIVSALFLIPQVWTYAGVPINVGQPELVATHPDYRRRGLIRAQFEVIHEWSRAGGQLWQFIVGIPWYYRQFGYSYALDLPPRPIMWLGPTSPPASVEFTVRAATSADVGFLAEVEEEATSGTMLGPLRGQDGFTLELARRPGGLLACEILVIEAAGAATPIGYVAHQRRLVDGMVSLRALELRRGTNWLGPTSAVVAHLDRWVRDHPDGGGRGVRFALPAGHPATRCAFTRLGWPPPGSYGVYVRVPDVVAFVHAIAPVLEARLAESPAVNWTGDLRIDLYQGGLRLRFDDGRLSGIEPWQPPAGDTDGADASIPRDDFLHLLLGNRTIHDVEHTTADCILNTDSGALLLDVLFPLMPNSSWEFC
jgi:GNAT superfamily N-acetyltransferase